MILKEYNVGKNDSGQRLDRFLTKQGLTIGVIMKSLRNKDIKVNGKRGKADYKLVEGDAIKIYGKFSAKGGLTSVDCRKFHGISTQLNIIYEDENILLADKPAGLLCHSNENDRQQRSRHPFGRDTDCLINRIKAYLYKKGEFSPENEHSFEPSLCNRIDRNTGGIVIAAKNAESLRVMNEKLKQRQITKLYLCILTDIPKQKEATLTSFLEKDESTNTVKIAKRKNARNKTIITKYRILDTRKGLVKDNLALAEVDLLTGRPHQIRAHMAYIGCPLLGDGKYGRNKVNKQYGFDKQALYSYKLIFTKSEENNHLDYLNDKCFEVDNIWFLEKFYKF